MKIHTVQKGDTLWKIAKQYNVDFKELLRANSQIKNPDRIMPGMKVRIPTGHVPLRQPKDHEFHHHFPKKEYPIPPQKGKGEESPVPEPEPVPEPSPEPMPEPIPEPAPAPAPAPVPTPPPVPTPAPAPAPAPVESPIQPPPQPQVRPTPPFQPPQQIRPMPTPMIPTQPQPPRFIPMPCYPRVQTPFVPYYCPPMPQQQQLKPHVLPHMMQQIMPHLFHPAQPAPPQQHHHAQSPSPCPPSHYDPSSQYGRQEFDSCQQSSHFDQPYQSYQSPTYPGQSSEGHGHFHSWGFPHSGSNYGGHSGLAHDGTSFGARGFGFGFGVTMERDGDHTYSGNPYTHYQSPQTVQTMADPYQQQYSYPSSSGSHMYDQSTMFNPTAHIAQSSQLPHYDVSPNWGNRHDESSSD